MRDCYCWYFFFADVPSSGNLHCHPPPLNRAARRAIAQLVREMGKSSKRTRQGSRVDTPVDSFEQQEEIDQQGAAAPLEPRCLPQESASGDVMALEELTHQVQTALDRITTLEGENSALKSRNEALERELRDQAPRHPQFSETSTSFPSAVGVSRPTPVQLPTHTGELLEHPIAPANGMHAPHGSHALRPPCQSTSRLPPETAYNPLPLVLSGRDEIPVFYGETPASYGLQRNREVESFISCVEMLTRPLTDEAFIRMARGRTRGYAQMVLLGPQFQGITTWAEFKMALRSKFRGVSTSQQFYEMLAQTRMTPGQSPMDFFQAVEMAVMQGARDYPSDLGDLEGLMRRTFTAGLPGWLRRQLALFDFLTTRRMAEKSQVAWDATVGVEASLPPVSSHYRPGPLPYQGSHHPQSLGLPRALGVPPSFGQMEGVIPPLDFYSDNPFQAATVHGTPASDPRHHPASQVHEPGLHRATSPLRQKSSPRRFGNQRRKWCEYHQQEGHPTSECRAKQRCCFNCGEPGHFVASCPFQGRRSGRGSQASSGHVTFEERANPSSSRSPEGQTADQDEG